MKKFSKIINSCQFSKKRDLIKILSLGFLPGVNQMFKINSEKNSEIFFPTNLVYSPSSSLFQIDNIVDKEISTYGLLEKGEKYVLTGGVPVGVPGTTNYLSVLTKN